jgi:hypothetical protein
LVQPNPLQTFVIKHFLVILSQGISSFFLHPANAIKIFMHFYVMMVEIILHIWRYLREN